MVIPTPTTNPSVQLRIKLTSKLNGAGPFQRRRALATDIPPRRYGSSLRISNRSGCFSVVVKATNKRCATNS